MKPDSNGYFCKGSETPCKFCASITTRNSHRIKIRDKKTLYMTMVSSVATYIQCLNSLPPHPAAKHTCNYMQDKQMLENRDKTSTKGQKRKKAMLPFKTDHATNQAKGRGKKELVLLQVSYIR